VLEITRFILSTIVLEAHVWPLNVPWLAWQSVFAFYTLSGFLMTRVLHVRYGFGVANACVFFLNRILRLYPAYLTVLALTWVALLIHPLDDIYPLLHLPRGPFDTTANITVLGLVGFDHGWKSSLTLMVPNSWSLSIELFCYTVLPLTFAKSPRHLVGFAVLGLSLLGYASISCAISGDLSGQYGPYCFQNRYGVLQAGFIPFATGGLLHFYRLSLRPKVDRFHILLIGAWCAATVLSGFYEPLRYTVAPFMGMLGMALLVIWAPLGRPAGRLVDYFGRASYHLFIAHWIVAGILVRWLSVERNSFVLCALTLVICLALSCALVPVERLIERWRHRHLSRSGAAAPVPIPRPV
jgi:peptidoglycan/LPS O-acetylase OafA/YrhL